MPDPNPTPPAPTPSPEKPKKPAAERGEINQAWLDEISATGFRILSVWAPSRRQSVQSMTAIDTRCRRTQIPP